jgi:hypothetical protein
MRLFLAKRSSRGICRRLSSAGAQSNLPEALKMANNDQCRNKKSQAMRAELWPPGLYTAGPPTPYLYFEILAGNYLVIDPSGYCKPGKAITEAD